MKYCDIDTPRRNLNHPHTLGQSRISILVLLSGIVWIPWDLNTGVLVIQGKCIVVHKCEIKIWSSLPCLGHGTHVRVHVESLHLKCFSLQSTFGIRVARAVVPAPPQCYLSHKFFSSRCGKRDKCHYYGKKTFGVRGGGQNSRCHLRLGGVLDISGGASSPRCPRTGKDG